VKKIKCSIIYNSKEELKFFFKPEIKYIIKFTVYTEATIIKIIPIIKNKELVNIILKKIKNSLAKLIKGGNPKFITPIINPQKPKRGVIKRDPTKENKLRVKKR